MRTFKRWSVAGAIVLVALALVACPSMVPTSKGSISDMTFEHAEIGESKKVLNLGRFFQDADGATYKGASDKDAVATASADGTTLTVTAKGVGEATVTVTATASNGRDTAEQMFKVTVKAAPKPDPEPDPDNNQPRLVADQLPNVDDLKVGHPQTIELGPLFIDDEDDTVTFRADSRAKAIATAVATATGRLTLTAVSVGTARIDIFASDGQHSDGRGNDVPVRESFNVMVVNQPPMAVTTGLSFRIGLRPEETDTRDLTPYFTDPEGHSMTYGASVEPSGVATASVDGTTLTIVAGANAGDATVTVTATDTHMGEGSTEFTLRVSDAPNQAPVVSMEIPDQSLALVVMDGMESATSEPIDLSMYFMDPDEMPMPLTYSDDSDMTMIDGSMLTITATAPGTTMITVTASDGVIADDATDTFEVTVMAPEAPRWKKEIPDVTLDHDDTSETFTLAEYFNDATGYVATSSAPTVVMADLNDEQTMLTLTREGEGSAVVEITPSNSGGNGPTQTITVTVEAARQPPTTKTDMMFEALKINMVGDVGNAANDATTFTDEEIAAVKAATKRFMLSTYVTDPDGDDAELKFSTATDDNAVVAVYTTPTTGPTGNVHLGNPSDAQLKQMTQEGSDITIRGRKAGTATITVTATDADMETKSWSFVVTVPTVNNTGPSVAAGAAIPDAFAGLDGANRLKSSSGKKTLKIDLGAIFDDPNVEEGAGNNPRTSGDSWDLKAMSSNTDAVTVRLVSTNVVDMPDEYNVELTPVGPGDAVIYFTAEDSFGMKAGGKVPEGGTDTDSDGYVDGTSFSVKVNSPPVNYSGDGDKRRSLSTENRLMDLVASWGSADVDVDDDNDLYDITDGVLILVDTTLTDDDLQGYFYDKDKDPLKCRIVVTGDSVGVTLGTDRDRITLDPVAGKSGSTTVTVTCWDQVGASGSEVDFEKSAPDTLTLNVAYSQSTN